MKKLKSKVFWVIFLLLTSFTLLIFATSTVRTYMERKNSISEILTKMPHFFEKDKKDPNYSPSKKLSEGPRKIYMDFAVYTVILDVDGNYGGLINNTNNDELDEDYIKKIANSIIANHDKDLYIGNLFVSNYSYSFIHDNTLIIIDNTELNNTLSHQLIINILLFIVAEIVIVVITRFITRWITIPVKESFERQKMFVADASHELKTPLSVIIASSDAYFNNKNDKWVKNIKSEAERMTKLVTELLDLAKTEKEQDLVMANTDLSQVVESSILTFESLFFENKIKLKYDIEPSVYFCCNSDLITQLMGILIDNAIKHCSLGGKVLINLSKKNKQIVLEVKNKGLPIKKEDEEKIFERFYKVDESRNRNSNNYGLGLAIAKNIVEKHNGNISVHSSNGYTTFKVIWNQK